MTDVLEVDPFANGNWMFVLDGRILEICGPIHPGWNTGTSTRLDSWRVHVTHLNVKVAGPDKKGFHEVAFCTRANPAAYQLTFTKLTDTQWSRFQTLLDAIANATGATAPGSTSDGLLATKLSALQGLLSEHGVRLGSQPEDVRNAVVTDLQAAGVPIDPKSLAIAPTDPAQLDAMLDVYQRHGLLPPDASID